MSALSYEYFVRRAFGGSARGGDPAGLAEADIYNLANDKTYLNKIKIGTGYAIAILNHMYGEEKLLRDPEDYEKMDEFVSDALNAEDANEIYSIIERYVEFEKELKALQNRY